MATAAAGSMLTCCVCCVQGLRNDLKAAMDELNQEELDQLAQQQVTTGRALHFE